MLIHFPTPYPEETFYSVLCRYYISTGIREMATVDRVQIAAANGRWCGAKRPQCGASGHL